MTARLGLAYNTLPHSSAAGHMRTCGLKLSLGFKGCADDAGTVVFETICASQMPHFEIIARPAKLRKSVFEVIGT
jgi:hypothetical protein